jgi:preprotein translocase subunit SecE
MKLSLQKLFDYFKEVKAEVKKVNWPTRKETIKRTLMVIAITVLVAAFLGLLDWVLTNYGIKYISS